MSSYKDEVLSTIPKEHRERFWKSIHKAHQDFRALPDYQRGAISRFKAIQAGCLWALMVNAAQMEFAGTEVTVTEKSNTLTFSFRGHVLVQLKKVDKKGRARWGRTKRGTAFKLGVALPGEPEKHWVYVGYMMDKDGIRLQRIVMAQGDPERRTRDRIPAWIEDLTEPLQLSLGAVTPEERKSSRVRPSPDVAAQRFRQLSNENKDSDATESA